MYQTELSAKAVPLQALFATCFDEEKFMGYCRACLNYNKKWSCPPYPFTPTEYLAPYRSVVLVGARIVFAEETILQNTTTEQMSACTDRVMKTVKDSLIAALAALEQKFPGSKALHAGGCHLCAECARPLDKACRIPQVMRYSLESLGFDVGKITKDYLGVELQWVCGRLPNYYMLTFGLLMAPPVEELPQGLAQTIAKECLIDGTEETVCS